MIVDSHCHLNYFEEAEIEGLINEAMENGVGIIQNVCTNLTEFDSIYAIAEKYENIYASIGIHPNELPKHPDFEVSDIAKHADKQKLIGIGETGLDYYYSEEHKSIQQEAFAKHIEASRQSGLPVIIHTRDADDDMCELLKSEMKNGEFTGVIHCFTGGEKLAKTALDLGLYISVSGIITFKNAHELRDVVKKVPLERLLIETDAPYLAPTPHRSKKNHPAYVRYVAEKLAEIMEVSLEECEKATINNFKSLFNLQ